MRTRTPGASGRRTTRSADRGIEQLGIVGRRDRRSASPLGCAAISSNASVSVAPSGPTNSCDRAAARRRQVVDDVAVARGDVGEEMRRCGRCPRAAPARRETRRPARPRPRDRRRSSRVRGSDGCRSERSPLRSLASSPRKVAAHGRARGCLARGRGPRRTARSRAATARACRPSGAPRRSQRMLEQGEQRNRREGRRAPPRREPREHAGRACRRGASPPESSTATFQRPSAAATRRASARSGVTSAAVLSGVSTASRSATAMASASSSALAASITDRRSSAARDTGAERRSLSRARQRSVGGRRAQRLRHQRLATVRRWRSERHDLVAVDADAREQAVQGELRMARRGCAIAAIRGGPPIKLHDVLVEIGIEAGQHHGAVRQAGDGREQLGGRRHRAGRAGGDHRASGAAARRAASALIRSRGARRLDCAPGRRGSRARVRGRS